MPNADNAKLQIESGQNLVPMEELTDDGDQINFSASAGFWSARAGFVPVIRPNGVRSGGVISPTVNNNEVSTAAMSVNLNGVITAVAADSAVAITRTAAGGAFQINSVTVDSGGNVTAVAGTEGSAFTEVRGDAGGPPLIPVDSVEVGQVRMTSNTDAAILANEIKQVVGTHQERWDFPLWTVDALNGKLVFTQALPLIHTGPVAKKVFVEYYTPIFADVPDANNVVPPEASFSVTSEQTYDRVVNSSSQSLGQGSFEARLESGGISDLVSKLKNQKLWFKFFPDKFQSSNIVFQGLLGIAREFPADGAIRATATVSSDSEAVDVEA